MTLLLSLDRTVEKEYAALLRSRFRSAHLRGCLCGRKAVNGLVEDDEEPIREYQGFFINKTDGFKDVVLTVNEAEWYDLYRKILPDIVLPDFGENPVDDKNNDKSSA